MDISRFTTVLTITFIRPDRPSLAASGTLIALYAISACIHLYLGLRWKTWFFTSMMIVGALNAIIGYTGRIIMYYNPFNFDGFMIQIGEYPPSYPSTFPMYF